LTDQLVHQRISRQHYNKWKRMIEVDLPRHTGVAAPLQVRATANRIPQLGLCLTIHFLFAG